MTVEVKQSRVKYCDALRVLAIALVVLVHVFADWRDLYLSSNRSYYFILTCVETITRVAVPIFFMLTGAFMLGRTKEERYIDFLKKRVLKLFVPFVIFSLIYYLYECWKVGAGVTPGEFLLKFSNNGIKYHFWFMSAIILIYLVLPFLNKMVLNLDRRALHNLIIVLFIANVLATLAYVAKSFGLAVFDTWIYPNEMRYINYLFLGHFLCHDDLTTKQRKWLYVCGVLALMSMPLLDIWTVGELRNDALFVAGTFAPFIAAAATFVLFKYNYDKWHVPKRVERFFTRTTPFVFYIYMLHVLVMELVKRTIFKVWLPNRFLEACGFIVVEFMATFAITYILAWGIYRGEKWLRRALHTLAHLDWSIAVGTKQIKFMLGPSDGDIEQA